jgi:conjugative transfer signal peptidase TraF
MPLGLYILQPASAIHRGAIVIACPPPEAQRIGVANGYLAPSRGLVPGSRCSSGSAPLLKYAIAFAGDEIDISKRGLSLNGHLLDGQTPARLDRSGRTLAAVPNGRYRLATGQVWLYSPARYSWDSRYFGPARLGDVLGTAAPLWTSSPVSPVPTPDRRERTAP